MVNKVNLHHLLHQAHAAHVDVMNGALEQCEDVLVHLSQKLAECFEAGGKLLICGNGGSASDALHIAAECTGRFVEDRRALPAIALSADNSAITAIANDYGYDYVFARQVEAYGNAGDMLIALSTSGSSPNILAALDEARKRNLQTALLTGGKGQKSKAADYVLAVPSNVTAHTQEAHIFLLHQLIALVEAQLF